MPGNITGSILIWHLSVWAGKPLFVIHKLFRTAPGCKVALYTDKQYLWEESGLCLKLNLFIKYNSSRLVGYVSATRRCKTLVIFALKAFLGSSCERLQESAELKCNIALWIFLCSWLGFFFPIKSLSRWKQHKYGCDLLFKVQFFWLLRQSRNSHSFPKVWKSDARNCKKRQCSSWCTAVTSAHCIKSRGSGFSLSSSAFCFTLLQVIIPPMSNSSSTALLEENVWSAFPVQTLPMLFHLA